MLDTVAFTVRRPKAYARITNDLRALDGVDGRSVDGKRYRDLVDSLVIEFGAHDPVRLRELAGLIFSREKIQAAVINGDARAAEDLVRISNLVTRREKELRARQRRAAAGPPAALRDRLAGRYPALTGERTAPEAARGPAEGSAAAHSSQAAGNGPRRLLMARERISEPPGVALSVGSLIKVSARDLDFRSPLDTARTGAVRGCEGRQEGGRRMSALQPKVSNRKLAKALGVNDRTVRRDAAPETKKISKNNGNKSNGAAFAALGAPDGRRDARRIIARDTREERCDEGAAEAAPS